VVGVEPGDICYVNLKAWGDEYYKSLDLPVGHRYVVECLYINWTTTNKRRIDVICPLFNDQVFEWDATAVRMYGMSFELSPDTVLVDRIFCRKYPRVME